MTPKGEADRALLNAIVAGLPRGLKLLTPEEGKRLQREANESRRKRVDGLLKVVLKAKVLSEMTGRPAQLEHAHLDKLVNLLTNILIEFDGTSKRTAGRPMSDHRLLVIDFLMRKQATPEVAPKTLHHNVAKDWNTTDSNVKKLVSENSRSATALLKKIGADTAEKTVQTAIRTLKRYRN